jgi:hypothetical protein
MRHERFALSACAAAVAVILGAAPAHAGSWWSSAVTSLGTGGPPGLADPGTEPVLGHNFIELAPFYDASNGMGTLVLVPTTGNKTTWEYINGSWIDLSDAFWGLNVTYGANYAYAYRSPNDSSPGKVSYYNFLNSTWADTGWGDNFTSVQVYTGAAGSSATGWATWNGGLTNCSTLACIQKISSGSPANWNPNTLCASAPQYFNAEQVACDYFNACTSTNMIWLSSGGVVQSAGTSTFSGCTGSFTVASSFPMTICGGSNVLYAVQIAYKNALMFALGDTGTYTGGPGNLYEYDSGSSCWDLLSGGPSSDTVMSINADNSIGDFGGGAGPYAVWATDNNNTIWAYCTAGTCATPPL